ncbi:MAG: carbon storage regulator [Maioricimonas sp. JB045]|uniref:carbon storage regulator n=1 Tax=Maioricimonas sp. JC845 TaxID=3232138 RepID=UPI003459637A
MRDIDCGIDDTIAIGEVTVTVLDIEENQVRLGIFSPDDEVEYQEVVLRVANESRPRVKDLAEVVCLN